MRAPSILLKSHAQRGESIKFEQSGKNINLATGTRFGHQLLHKICFTGAKKNIVTMQEQQEMLLVIVANAVIDPWTVMIHPSNAALARGAVVTLRYLQSVAFLTTTLKNRFQLNDLLRL